MVNGISGSAPTYTSLIVQTAAASQTQADSSTRSSAQPVPPGADSVTLSATAQAHVMQHQGMAVKAIAANMGVTTPTVESYLGNTAIATGGGGSGSIAALKAVAAHVRVNPPASGVEA